MAIGDAPDKPGMAETLPLKHIDDAETGDDEGIVDAEATQGRLTWPLFVAVSACALGSSFQFGYNTGVVNAPQVVVEQWINDSHYDMFGKVMLENHRVYAWSLVVSVFAIGGMIGGLMSGWFADKFGRKGGMLLNNVFAFAAAALLGCAKLVNVWPILILGRLVIGFNAGLNSGLAPMYLTEVGPVNLRGSLGSVHQLVVTISILISQIFGLPWILGNETWWPLLFGLTAAPALFQVIVLPLCPESPKYSLIGKHQREQAEKDLLKLRQKDDVSAELRLMQHEADQAKNVPKVSFGDMFRDPVLSWPLFIAVMMMFSQQFSGINVAIYYSTNVFIGAGLTETNAIYATLVMGAMNVGMTIVSVWLVDHPKFGRRTLHLAGLAGMWFCSIMIVVFITIQRSGGAWGAMFAVIFVLAFVVSFATGPGSIPWFYVSELFLQGARGNANSVAVMTNWLANFCVGLLFLPLKKLLRQFAFLVFTALLMFFWLFTWKFVPETKGHSIESIVQQFRDRADKKRRDA